MKSKLRTSLLAVTVALASPLVAQDRPAPVAVPERDGTATLEDQFRDPPNSARPRVWWHWLSGNVTKEAIAKDLAWMKRIGIGGFQNFDASVNTPQVVKERLLYMTPAWKDAFAFAASEADRLGLEMAIAASPGWSETGGPWVKPEDGLKKLVWSQTDIIGARRFAGKLSQPPTTIGPFASIPMQKGAGAALTGEALPDTPQYYADVAVLAFPVVSPGGAPVPSVRIGDGKPMDGAALTDGDLASAVMIDRPAQGDPSVQFEYSTPQTIRSATLFMPGAASLFSAASFAPVLEASDDARDWRKVTDMAIDMVPATASFSPVTARFFRLVLKRNAGASGPSVFNMAAPGLDMAALAAAVGRGGSAGANAPVSLGEFRLSSEPLVDRYEAKAGFKVETDYYRLSQGVPDLQGVDPGKVIDLTTRMGADGSLRWTPPAGRWRVLRLGYSLLGTVNHPAPREATGLEVDKYDGAAVRRYLEHYIGLYRDAAGSGLLGKRGVQAILTDSIEVGAANWTPQLLAQFKRLRGYDPVPWLPALTGTIIGSRSASDRFLYDYRRTLSDLMASEHYGTIAAVAHANGLKVYGEALESGRPSLGDDMSMRRYADIPMSAMWTHSREMGPQPAHVADIRGAASVAHIYGQNLVAAESLTSSLAFWDHAPAYLKRIIDLAFVNGVNRPIIHTSVLSPTDDKEPGLSLFIFGQFFNRHESWAEMAKPWVDYLARNALMLQQGRNVADVAYFYGEEAPLTALYEKALVTDAPRANAYDFISADALAGALTNDGNELVTPGGARYRALYLGGSSRHMTLPLLLRLAELVEGGATVIGLAPQGDPGLRSDNAAYAALLTRLWPGGVEARVGKGRVIALNDIDAALRRAEIAPQFHYVGGQAGSSIPFVQRRLADGDSFFLVNQRDHTETIEARFRVSGKAPELWDPVTGKTEPTSYRTINGETAVPLTLTADQSVHIVFRKSARVDALVIPKPVLVERGRVAGPWRVAFQQGRGAPDTAIFAKLAPLESSSDPGIRYFSGVASYSSGFVAPSGWREGQPLWVDLGEVHEVAEVLINGKSAGSAWHAPYRIEIGDAVRRGRNIIEVRAANLWVNRLIGDAQPGARKVTWTPLPTYRADAPLRPSGLIGPVTILGIEP